MSEIFDRYYVRYESEYLEHDVEGKFMLYDDYATIVNILNKEIEELRGKVSNLQNTQQWYLNQDDY